MKKRGLGRGLDTLLGSISEPATVEQAKVEGSDLRHIEVDLIQRSRYQPRQEFDQTALEELADSIRAQGVVQPVVVRPLDGQKGRFELIAGERRWRASQLAGLQAIPAVVRHVDDQAAMAMGLIENIQREALNPIEEANALHRLIDEFGLTHQETAEAVGRSRASVTNLLRLLSLDPSVKHLVEHRELEMGHARALLALQGVQQAEAARQVVRKGLSVRETEHLVRRLAHPKPNKPASSHSLDPDTQRLQDDLSDRLGAKVQFQPASKGKGKLVIHYNSLDELEGILDHIK